MLVRLDRLAEMARDSLEIKRKLLQRLLEDGQLPQTARLIGNLRGHGATIAGYSLEDAVMTSIMLQVNAQIQLDAIGLGGTVEYLSQGEIDARRGAENEQSGFTRAWEHFSRRAGR